MFIGKQADCFPKEAPIDRRKSSQVMREELLIQIHPLWQVSLHLRGLEKVLVEVCEEPTFLVRIVKVFRPFHRTPKCSNSVLGHDSSSRHSRIVKNMFGLGNFYQSSNSGSASHHSFAECLPCQRILTHTAKRQCLIPIGQRWVIMLKLSAKPFLW